MARPLKKTKPDGARYVRPSTVEAQIDETLQVPVSTLRPRLLVTDPSAAGYLSAECLVHLVRHGRRTDDQTLMSAVLPVLLGRCEANLLVKVPNDGMPDAANLRQEILDELTDLFARDTTTDSSDELDFFECKFNRAFRTLRIDAVRREVRRRRSAAVADLPRSGRHDRS